MDTNADVIDKTGSAAGWAVRVLKIKPVPKPRMTVSDKWKKRPAVMRYREFCDQVRASGVELPESGATVVFHIGMPNSWSKKKKAQMDGMPHQQRPDLDNYFKALGDAVHEEDSGIWDVRMTKRWACESSISIQHGA